MQVSDGMRDLGPDGSERFPWLPLLSAALVVFLGCSKSRQPRVDGDSATANSTWTLEFPRDSGGGLRLCQNSRGEYHRVVARLGGTPVASAVYDRGDFVCEDTSSLRMRALLAMLLGGKAIGEERAELLLGGLTARQRKALRNAPYARHGKVFKTEWLYEFFYGGQATGRTGVALARNPAFSEKRDLSATDWQNVKLVKEHVDAGESECPGSWTLRPWGIRDADIDEQYKKELELWRDSAAATPE